LITERPTVAELQPGLPPPLRLAYTDIDVDQARPRPTAAVP
jgi:hypothetical protein